MDRRWYVMRSVWLLSVQIGLLLWVSLGQAQTTSITSSGLGTTISPASIDPAGRPNYTITGGTRPGDGPNLFHSFGDFSVGTNNVARFFNETGRATTNILSRVTSGNPSAIFGEISTQSFGSANLFLINPAGVVFGPAASLNVGGSVHFSTADYLRLGSGNDRFYADLGKTSQLTSAPVTAFGFLGERPAGPITVQGGNALTVSEGKALSLVGGDITIAGRTLSAPGGQINVASVKSAAEAFLNPVGQSPGLDVVASGQTSTGPQPTTAEGTVLIRGGELVGAVTLGNNAALQADALSVGKAGNIDIEAKTLNMSPGSLISAATAVVVKDGNSSTISASELIKISGATIVSGPLASGNQANVTITSPGVVALTDATIKTDVTVLGEQAGNISIQSDQLSMDNARLEALVSSASGGQSGDVISGGDIALTATSMNLSNSTLSNSTIGNTKAGSMILRGQDIVLQNSRLSGTSNLSLGGPGNVGPTGGRAGTVTIEGINGPAQKLTISNSAIDTSILTAGSPLSLPADIRITSQVVTLTDHASITAKSTGAAPAGNINIDAGTLTMNPGTNITASTSGSGNAGNISITASDHVTLSGPDTKVSSDTSSTGNAGSIIINTNRLTNNNTIATGGISSSSKSKTDTAGSAGHIVIRGQDGGGSYAESVVLDNGTIYSSIAGGTESSMPASIDIRSQSVTLANAATIDAGTTGTDQVRTAPDAPHIGAPGGNINISVASLSMNSAPPSATIPPISTPTSQISATTSGPGRGGNITIHATDHVTLSGGQISTMSKGTTTGKFPECSNTCGQAGTITITAPALTLEAVESAIGLKKVSGIGAQTQGSGAAGTISLDVASLLIKDSNPPSETAGTVFKGIDASTIGSGAGGKIDIRADSIRLEAGLISTQGGENSGSGAPGNIEIAVGQLTLLDGSLIRANNKGPTAGGTLTIHGKGSASADIVSISHSILSTGTTGTANGGPLNIAANTINLTDGAVINSSATGAGDAGTISITASDHVTLSGPDTKVSSDTSSTGNAGSLTINANQLTINNRGGISSSSTSPDTSAGSAGQITIQGLNGKGSSAQTFTLDNSTIQTTVKGGKFVDSPDKGDQADPSPGQIHINAQSLNLANGGTIRSDTSAVVPKEDLAANEVAVPAGAITLLAGSNLSLTSGATISSSSTASAPTQSRETTTSIGNAGNIQLTTGDSISLTNSTVLTTAADASGGNITLTAPNMVRLVGATLKSSVFGPAGSNGGNISIDTVGPQFVILQGNSQIRAEAIKGSGGDITIHGGVVLQEPGSVLDATSALGVSGSINIQAPFQQLSGAIAPLPQAFAVATNLYGQRCATEKGGQFSSFVQGARDGVPPQPGDLIPSPLLLESDGTSPSLASLSAPNLAAVRLGLPEFDHPAPVTFLLSAGCRS